MNKNGFLSFRCPLFYRFRHKKKPALAKGGLFFYSKNQLQTVARPLGCVWYFAKPVARPLGCVFFLFHTLKGVLQVFIYLFHTLKGVLQCFLF
jgi:hypothetical protein